MADPEAAFREAGELVRTARQRAGLSGRRLATEAGVPYATVLEIQRGWPCTAEDFGKIAAVLLLRLGVHPT